MCLRFDDSRVQERRFTAFKVYYLFVFYTKREDRRCHNDDFPLGDVQTGQNNSCLSLEIHICILFGEGKCLSWQSKT